MKTARSRPPRAAFTLVEMLVVVIIIGILAALLIPALYRAWTKAQATRIALELSQLDSAVSAYNTKHQDYPPDFTSRPLVERHIRKVFSRISDSEMTIVRNVFWVEPTNTNDPNYYVSRVDPAEALVLWLGGFSDDPQFPFTGEGGPFTYNGTDAFANENRNQGFYDFDQTRLTLAFESGGTARVKSTDEALLHGRPVAENDAFPVYFPAGLTHPYVYFDSDTYEGMMIGTTAYMPVYPPSLYTQSTTIQGTGRPYGIDIPNRPARYANEDGYQIISAGLDDHYGADNISKVVPTQLNFIEEDLDNLTNFSDGQLLGDMEEQ